MLRRRVVREAGELERAVPAWRELLARASNAQPVLTPLWLGAWWRQFGEADGRALRVLLIEDGRDLVGMVPLSMRRAARWGAIPVRRLELLGTGEDEADEIGSDYVGGLAARGREEQVAIAAAAALAEGELGPWDELHMKAMSGDDPLVPALRRALRARGLGVEVSTTGQCPFIALPPTWEGYLDVLGGARRYAVRRTLRDLDAWAGEAGWQLRHAATEADLREGRRALIDLHAARWRAAGREGVFASRRFTAFHDEVMPRLHAGEDGASLDLSWLVVRGEPVAASYCVRFRGKVHFYQSGRRVDVPRSLRVGIAMHALAIRRAIEGGLSEYDFLAGASRYKRDLALAGRPIVALRAVAAGARPRAIEAARRLGERALGGARAARRLVRGRAPA